MNHHPANQTATAVCWSLRRSWAAWRDTNTTSREDGLRSTIWGNRHGTGGHGDPTATAAEHANTTGRQLADHVNENVAAAWWLTASATRQQPLPTAPALAVIGRLIDTLDPATAHEIAGYLDTADRAIRRTLRLGDDHWPPPGNPKCPACTTRMLRARTSNPDRSAWPVICAAGCQCTGDTCGCGTPVRVRGANHIWPADHLPATLNLDTITVEASA